MDLSSDPYMPINATPTLTYPVATTQANATRRQQGCHHSKRSRQPYLWHKFLLPIHQSNFSQNRHRHCTSTTDTASRCQIWMCLTHPSASFISSLTRSKMCALGVIDQYNRPPKATCIFHSKTKYWAQYNRILSMSAWSLTHTNSRYVYIVHKLHRLHPSYSLSPLAMTKHMYGLPRTYVWPHHPQARWCPCGTNTTSPLFKWWRVIHNRWWIEPLLAGHILFTLP